MNEHHQAIQQAYTEAKRGAWEPLLAKWRQYPQLAMQCSRYKKSSSGWTFLHQAAYFGHEAACRELIRLGADPGVLSKEQQRAADVASERKFPALAELLQKATERPDSGWGPPQRPNLLPSSCHWEEAVERRASATMRVSYSGAVVEIPAGSRYYVDAFERTLIGWHGTYDPPSGMGAKSML